MNITIFADALDRLYDFHKDFQTLTELQKLATAATNAGANPTHEQAYVDEKKRILEDVSLRADTFLFDYQLKLIEDASLNSLLPSQFIEELTSLVGTNENTMTVLGSELIKLKDRTSTKLDSINSLLKSLKSLSIDVDFLEEGDAAIIVHFRSFDAKRNPKQLATNLGKVTKTVENICTKVGGDTIQLELIALSNPTPTIIFGTTVAGVFAFSRALKALSEALLTLQEVRLKGVEVRNQKMLSDALKKKLERIESERKEAVEEAAKEQIGIIAEELYKGSQKNGHLGLAKDLKQLVETIHNGISYDTIAIPHTEETPDSNDVDQEPEYIETQSQLLAISASSGNAETLAKLLESNDVLKLLLEEETE